MRGLAHHRREASFAARDRLAALAPLDPSTLAALDATAADPITTRARRDILAEGAPIPGPRLMLSGWAARVRILADGRRQFLSFLLPGDLIGWCGHARPLATATVTALTDVQLCPAPAVAGSPGLREAYALSQALHEAYLLEQIARLGRLNALERIYSLLLELHERLSLNGLAVGGAFEVPLTQELLGDALGLTSVHVNRMVQLARRNGHLDWKGGRVSLTDPPALARLIGRAPVRVAA